MFEGLNKICYIPLSWVDPASIWDTVALTVLLLHHFLKQWFFQSKYDLALSFKSTHPQQTHTRIWRILQFDSA